MRTTRRLGGVWAVPRVTRQSSREGVSRLRKRTSSGERTESAPSYVPCGARWTCNNTPVRSGRGEMERVKLNERHLPLLPIYEVDRVTLRVVGA